MTSGRRTISGTRSARAQMSAPGPSVISRYSRLGGYLVVLRKSIVVRSGPPLDCQGSGSPYTPDARSSTNPTTLATPHARSHFRRSSTGLRTVSYTHLRAHETPEHLVCRL